MSWSVRAAFRLCGVGLAACGWGASAPDAPAVVSTAGWLDGVGPMEGTWCAPEVAPPEVLTPRRLSVRLLVGEGVPLTGVQAQLAQAVAYWAAFGVQVDLAPELVVLPDKALLAGDATLTDQDALLASVFSRARDVVQTYGLQDTAQIQVVFTRFVAEPGTAADRAFSSLAGLTLAADRPVPEGVPFTARQALDVTTDAAPLVLLGLQPITQVPPGVVDLTVAHELGHAMGLQHRVDGDALMQPERPRCLAGLTAADLAVVQAHTQDR